MVSPPLDRVELEETVREKFDALRSRALATLQYLGQVHLIEDDPLNNPLRLGPTDARTCSNEDASEHEIHVLRDSYATNGTILHEFCHVKINELGFKRVELDFVERTKAICTTEIQLTRREQALYVVAEAYADSVLFSRMKMESFLQLTQSVMGYSDPAILRQVSVERGFLGIGQTAAFRTSLKWAGIGSYDARLELAATQGFSPQDLEKYGRICAMLSELRPIVRGDDLSTLDPPEVERIVRTSIALYEYAPR